MGVAARRPVRPLAAAVALAAVAVLAPVAGLRAPLATPAAASTGPDRPTRILVVGDSITAGQTGSATWRYWLWRETLRQGVAVRMVGPNQWLAYGRHYEHLDHGFAQQKRHGSFPGSGYEKHTELITRRIRRFEPDVVLAQIGYNDIEWNEPASAARTARLAMRFTRRVLAADPRVRLVLGEVPSSSRRIRGKPGFAEKRNTLAAETDRRIGRALARLDSPRVYRTNLRTHPKRGWRPRKHTFDGVHANSTGETLMAEHFATALYRMRVLPHWPRVWHREPWEPRPRLNRVETRRGSAVLRWGKDARWNHAERYVARVRVGGRVRRFQPRRSGQTVLTLPRGRYAVRMVAKRGTMTSRPGPRQWVAIR